MGLTLLTDGIEVWKKCHQVKPPLALSRHFESTVAL